ncbi:hypothetical protein EWM64_g1261 [Hericium alpestre]|uniref:Uncharacterized protein n=1 Tax=Hericium alpestre TaxID=135208 RepID=A0A4Z0AB12_9AGAM|nr:hypothetical protein EWM64_g1261 [Hericium alpestre]
MRLQPDIPHLIDDLSRDILPALTLNIHLHNISERNEIETVSGPSTPSPIFIAVSRKDPHKHDVSKVEAALELLQHLLVVHFKVPHRILPDVLVLDQITENTRLWFGDLQEIATKQAFNELQVVEEVIREDAPRKDRPDAEIQV